VKIGSIGRSMVGRMGDPEPLPAEDEIRRNRSHSARKTNAWTELEAADLVPRGNGRFLVSATDDSVYTEYRGHVWNASGGVEHSEANPLYWFVDEAGDVQLLERQPETWSERTYRAAGAR
jgi:hypothetical protein